MSDFKAKRIVRNYIQTINADSDTIFPLLCPVKEADWLDGWQCKVLHAESGYAEKDGVYATQHEGEDDDTIWMITHRDEKNHEIEFVYFVPGIRVTKLNISIKPESKNKSSVHIQYIYTAISEAGNSIIELDFGEKNFVKNMKHWEDSMNYYLKKGEVLKSK